MTKKEIAWVIPSPEKGSGGIRTIFNNALKLEKEFDVINHFYILPAEYYIIDIKLVKENIKSWFGYKVDKLYQGKFPSNEYDVIIATSNETANFISSKNYDNVVYFIQDYEPYFYASGSDNINAKNSYTYNFKKLTIGKWLSSKIAAETDQKIPYCNFGADLNIYKPTNSKNTNSAICAIFQPNKYRRASNILIEAIKIINIIEPDLKIYLYGETIDDEEKYGVNAKYLGLISPEECCKLYNDCVCGVSISTTNPSRIPFEMMASGLPVIDLYTENNFYDFSEDGILLATPTPESIAQSVIEVIHNTSIQKKMAKSGVKFMLNRTIDNESQEFAKIIDSYISDTEYHYEKPSISYKKKPVTINNKIIKVANSIKVNKYNSIINTQEIKECKNLKLKLKINNSKLDKVKIAIWRDKNQTDIKWVSLKCQKDGESYTYFDMSQISKNIYSPLNIHIYYECDGNLKFVTSHSLLLDNTIDSDKIKNNTLIDKLTTNEMSLEIYNWNKYPKLKVKIISLLNK